MRTGTSLGPGAALEDSWKNKPQSGLLKRSTGISFNLSAALLSISYRLFLFQCCGICADVCACVVIVPQRCWPAACSSHVSAASPGIPKCASEFPGRAPSSWREGRERREEPIWRDGKQIGSTQIFFFPFCCTCGHRRGGGLTQLGFE